MPFFPPNIIFIDRWGCVRRANWNGVFLFQASFSSPKVQAIVGKNYDMIQVGRTFLRAAMISLL